MVVLEARSVKRGVELRPRGSGPWQLVTPYQGEVKVAPGTTVQVVARNAHFEVRASWVNPRKTWKGKVPGEGTFLIGPFKSQRKH